MSAVALDAGVARWIEDAVGPGSRVVAITEMPRAQTRLLAVDVEDGGGVVHQLVLRRYNDASLFESDPWYSPTNEATALRLLEATTVPAPMLIGDDLDGAVCGQPALLTTRLQGSIVIHPDDLGAYLTQIALVLPQIHAVEANRRVPAYAPYADDAELVVPTFSSRPQLWARVFEIVDDRPPVTRWCFIHRDFHPSNVLWLEKHLSGILDWPTASWGPWGIDLARMRVNLAGDLGPEAADRFLEIHATVTGEGGDRHPYWDLLDAADLTLDAGPPADAEEAAGWERFETWVASVVAEL